MRYLKISFLLDATVGDEATAALAEAGLPCERCDQTTLDKPPPGQVQLNLYADPGSSTQGDAEAALAEAGLAAQVEVAECDDGAWQDRWKDYFRPRPIGRFVIVPSWESYTASGDEVVLDLDPGRAFGTGGHASTRLCLVAISTLGRCKRFLDVGCGSGVLAIACARLWPEATGLAIDVDPEAVEVTRENAERNGVAARLTASTAPLHRVQGSFDLVLCSLTLHHFTTADAVTILHQIHQLARGGYIVNDLRRNWLTLWTTAFFARTLSRSPIFRNDALQSCRAAFTVRELRALAEQAGLSNFQIEPHQALCRMVLTGRK